MGDIIHLTSDNIHPTNDNLEFQEKRFKGGTSKNSPAALEFLTELFIAIVVAAVS